MLLVQKPDPKRNLNLSPFRLYVLVNNDLKPKREALQKMADKISTNNFKIELVDFDASTQQETLIGGNEIDIHLYKFITMVHLFARVFPKNETDFTFLPDTVDQLSESLRFEERLESKLKGVLRALISFATDNIKALPEIETIPESMNIDDYLDSLEDEQRYAFLLKLQAKLKYPSPEESGQNLKTFLDYRFGGTFGEKDGVFPDENVDLSRIPPTFKIVISKSNKKLTERDVQGLIDISIVADEGEEHTIMNFKTRQCKMAYLMILLSYKYSFGLPTDLYKGKEGGAEAVASIADLLYKWSLEDYIDTNTTEVDKVKSEQTKFCNQINNQSLKEDNYTKLNKTQYFWLSVYLEPLYDGEGLNVRKIKLPKERIVISDDLIEAIKSLSFPTLDMYRPGYVPEKILRHVIK